MFPLAYSFMFNLYAFAMFIYYTISTVFTGLSTPYLGNGTFFREADAPTPPVVAGVEGGI